MCKTKIQQHERHHLEKRCLLLFETGLLRQMNWVTLPAPMLKLGSFQFKVAVCL